MILLPCKTLLKFFVHIQIEKVKIYKYKKKYGNINEKILGKNAQYRDY